jgi:hypothetical protein
MQVVAGAAIHRRAYVSTPKALLNRNAVFYVHVSEWFEPAEVCFTMLFGLVMQPKMHPVWLCSLKCSLKCTRLL